MSDTPRTDAALNDRMLHWPDLARELERELAEAKKALTRIACFNDASASERLRLMGSYSAFDEPGSVEIARNALK